MENATALNTKMSKVKNKISVVSNLVKKSDYDTMLWEIEGKYFLDSDYNKFTSNILNPNLDGLFRGSFWGGGEGRVKLIQIGWFNFPTWCHRQFFLMMFCFSCQVQLLVKVSCQYHHWFWSYGNFLLKWTDQKSENWKYPRLSFDKNWETRAS